MHRPCDFVHELWFFFFWFLSVRPSVPKCWVEGSEEKGGTVSLCCKSSQGSSPLKYAWTKEGGNMPPTATQSESPPLTAGLVPHYSANTWSESLIFGPAWITCSFRPVSCKVSCCRWKQKQFLSLIATKQVLLCAICRKQHCRAFRNGCTFWMTLCLKIPWQESCWSETTARATRGSTFVRSAMKWAQNAAHTPFKHITVSMGGSTKYLQNKDTLDVWLSVHYITACHIYLTGSKHRNFSRRLIIIIKEN